MPGPISDYISCLYHLFCGVDQETTFYTKLDVHTKLPARFGTLKVIRHSWIASSERQIFLAPRHPSKAAAPEIISISSVVILA